MNLPVCRRALPISIVLLCLQSSCNQHDPAKLSAPVTSVYNPYPPGILPADLDSEITRVLAEVDGIESQALDQWHALTPPTLTGQPPTLQNTGTAAVEI